MKGVKIEEVLALIIAGKTFREIAEDYGVAVSTLHEYLHKSEHSARVNDALKISANSYADKAEEVLKDITRTSNQIEMARARELAQHYRWKASKRNPRSYGDKLDVTSNEKTLPAPVIIAPNKKSE